MCLCACTHERWVHAEPTQPYESLDAPAEHRRKICFGFQEDITGKEYWHPFKGGRVHISSQLYNAFVLLADLKYFPPLPHHAWRDSVGPKATLQLSRASLSGGAAHAAAWPPWITHRGLLWPVAWHSATSLCWAIVPHKFWWFPAP